MVVTSVLTVVSTLLTVLGSVGAYFLGGLNERKRDERALARDETARRQNREEDLERERHEFQLANLLKLQESLRRVTRSAFLIITADRHSVAATGNFTLLPPETSEGGFANSIRFGRLVERVVDDKLREELKAFNSYLSNVSLPPTDWRDLKKQDAEELLHDRYVELARKASDVGALLGVQLRSELNRRETV